MNTANLSCMLFLASLLTACGGGGSSGSASDDDSQSEPGGSSTSVSISTGVTVVESAGQVTIGLALTGDHSITLRYTTVAGSATDADFVSASGDVTLSTSNPSASVVISLHDDFVLETPESFQIHWSSDDSSVTFPSATTITLTDDDALSAIPTAGSFSAIDLFHPASDCTRCHKATNAGSTPAAMRTGDTTPSPGGADISPGADWRHSLMAHSMNDPWYQAKVKAEAAENPALASFIEDKCLGCHAPMAHTLANDTGRLITAGDDPTCTKPEGCLSLNSALSDAIAREGISCTLCHRIDNQVMTGDHHSGDYPLDASATPQLFGPFLNPVTQPMLSQLGKVPAAADHMLRSEHCASCHDLFTPVLDVATRQPTGDQFPEQTPFREWRNSVYARGQSEATECQECHMPADPDLLTPIAVRPDGTVNSGWPQRAPYARHVFVGGNTHMLKILRDFAGSLGLSGTTRTGFDQKIAETQALLSRAATLAIDQTEVDDDELELRVTIHNHSGHKLPTGYPSRRVWLALSVRDSTGDLIFQSGVPDSEGRLPIDATLESAGCVNIQASPATCVAPHVDVVTDAAQVPIYESVLGTTEDQLTHTLLLADHYLKDNRIPPRGFSASDARYDPATAVIGIGADDDFNANGNGADAVDYRIDVEDSEGPWTIEATLYYQSIRPSFIAATAGDSASGRNFRILMATVPPAPETLATASLQISD